MAQQYSFPSGRPHDDPYDRRELRLKAAGQMLVPLLIAAGIILAAIATVGLDCVVEVEKKDGQITVVYEKKN